MILVASGPPRAGVGGRAGGSMSESESEAESECECE